MAQNRKLDAQAVLRLPSDLKEFYEAQAQREQRKLADVMRLALEAQRRITEQQAA